MRRRLILALVLAGTLGCQALREPAARALLPHLASCPGLLLPTDAIPGDFVRHERVRVRGDGVDESYALVAQKRGDRLVLVGFSAFGAKAFSVVQQGLAVTSESHLGAALPIPPENVLRDLHRARFLAEAGDAEGGRTLTREADGSLRVGAARCGYETTFAPPAEVSLEGRASFPVAVSGSSVTHSNARGIL